MTEARQCGLRFKTAPDADPDSIVNTEAARDKDGRIYDLRSGLGSYYRYGPRKLAELCDEKFQKSRETRYSFECRKFTRVYSSAFKVT